MRYGVVTKIFHFESAHHLPGHRGKCAHLHGHSYRLEVTIRGPIKDMPGESDHGMVMDFGDLSRYHLTISGREKLIRWENPFCSEREGSACEGAIEDRHAERDQRENALDS